MSVTNRRNDFVLNEVLVEFRVVLDPLRNAVGIGEQHAKVNVLRTLLRRSNSGSGFRPLPEAGTGPISASVPGTLIFIAAFFSAQ